LSARNLYKDMTSFRVQFTLQLSTNVTTAFTSLDGGIERSLAVVPWPYRFVRRPAAEDERMIDPTLKSEAIVAKHAVELVYLLMLVDSAWRNFDDCRVSPMPVLVQEATKKFLMKDTEDQVGLFVQQHMEVVEDARHGSTDAQIVRALRGFLQLKGQRGLQDSREALEKHCFSVITDGRRLMRPKGKQSGYVALKQGMDVD
jgi:phage/plasmid-associated DNA primase